MTTAQDFVLLARVADAAGRYDDARKFMVQRVQTGGLLQAEPLNSSDPHRPEDERGTFSAAFKNTVQERRNALQELVKETMKGDEENKTQWAHDYIAKVRAELTEICDECVLVLRQYLLEQSPHGEPKTFYYKMMA